MSNWINTIDKNTTAFIEHFGNLTNQELNWKPNPETWSIAQNINHLIRVSKSYFPLLEKLRAEKKEKRSNISEQVKATGEFLLQSVQPNREQKIKTFAIWEPSLKDIKNDMLSEFSNHQVQLKMEIENSSELIENEVVIASPANQEYEYPITDAFDIIVVHQQRHLEQAKEVLRQLKWNE